MCLVDLFLLLPQAYGSGTNKLTLDHLCGYVGIWFGLYIICSVFWQSVSLSTGPADLYTQFCYMYRIICPKLFYLYFTHLYCIPSKNIQICFTTSYFSIISGIMLLVKQWFNHTQSVLLHVLTVSQLRFLFRILTSVVHAPHICDGARSSDRPST
jgi:hypothetical protein